MLNFRRGKTRCKDNATITVWYHCILVCFCLIGAIIWIIKHDQEFIKHISPRSFNSTCIAMFQVPLTTCIVLHLMISLDSKTSPISTNHLLQWENHATLQSWDGRRNAAPRAAAPLSAVPPVVPGQSTKSDQCWKEQTSYSRSATFGKNPWRNLCQKEEITLDDINLKFGITKQ